MLKVFILMKRIFKLSKKFNLLKKKNACLSIVGVGPGDPELLTLAAIKVLKKADVIAYPLASKDKESYSANIVKKYIRYKTKLPIVFPMSRKGFDPIKIWEEAAKEIVKFILKGKSVVLICLGDTSFYASSSFIRDEIYRNYPKILISTIPGISSFSAAASRINFDLVRKGDSLLIFECPDNAYELKTLINSNRGKKCTLVIMKVSNRWEWVKQILNEEELSDRAFLGLNIGMQNQIIIKASEETHLKLPYFSLIILKID